MASINLEQSHKTVCKYCGLTKKSLVPDNFVCGSCKKFCEQQLSGAELKERDYEVSIMIAHMACSPLSETEQQFILKMYKKSVAAHESVSNEQYLAVKRILKKGNLK